MVKEIEGYRFDIPQALQMYKFDETNNISPFYHGVSVLKAVDVMVEMPKCYVWIEIKYYDDEIITELKKERNQVKQNDTYHTKSWLRNNLLHKYRDTFLYRYAENKLDKPIVYICLLNFDKALKSYFRGELQHYIPCDIPTKRWKKSIIDALIVVDENDWKHNPQLMELGTCTRVRTL